GLGHAVGVARPLVGDEFFAVFLPDDVIASEVPCMRQMLDVHARTGASVIAIQPVAPEQVSSYGIIAGERTEERLWRLTGLVEKPRPGEAPSRYAVVGRYILSPRIFSLLEDGA